MKSDVKITAHNQIGQIKIFSPKISYGTTKEWRSNPEAKMKLEKPKMLIILLNSIEESQYNLHITKII